MIKKITALSLTAIMMAVITVFVLAGAVGNNTPGAQPVRVSALERGSFEQGVNLTGTVYSAQTTEVHSVLHFPVERVYVRVGDRVAEGDLLARLDMQTLEMSVQQLQAGLGAAQAAAGQNLAMAQNALHNMQRNVATGADPAIHGARLGVEAARLGVLAAEAELTAVTRNLGNARRDLRDWRRYSDFYDDWDPTQSQLRSHITALESAQMATRTHIEIAREQLAQAEESYQAALILSADALAAQEGMVRAAQISTNFGDQQIAIASLQTDLERGEIRATATGTITAVLAEEGAPGMGLLFVIQDTDNLIVRTNIREMDIAAVSIGDNVNIRTDATGSAEFSGTLGRIAPTSTAMAHGNASQGAAYAEFESEVAVARGSGLRIGMSTRLWVVTNQASDVFTVPAGAITTDMNGRTIIFAAMPEEAGYVARAVQVSLGTQSGQSVQILAESLADGLLVIENTAGLYDGALVTPRNM